MTNKQPDGKVKMEENKDIMIVNEETLQDKIYEIRGQQVMLDYDLAEIYGYKTYKLNEQVRNNAKRFDGEDFMFQLTKEEFDSLISKNRISSWGGRRKLPYAFTEQGIYMLMTVLKGALAIEQSKQLIRLFKQMKDYIIENHQLMLSQNNYLMLADQVSRNTADIKDIKENMIAKEDLPIFMKLFDSMTEHEEILILDGEPSKADLAYQRIYRKAKRNCIIIDDYISLKTLQHLLHTNNTVQLTVISDNKARPKLTKAEYADFQTENPNRDISFIASSGKVHDRYIILDYGTRAIKVFHCGASSKDAGKRITTITRVEDVLGYNDMVERLISNQPLALS